MRDAGYVLAILWKVTRSAPVKWDARRVLGVLRCAWNIYRTRRRLRRMEADIRRFSSDVRFL